MMFKKFDFLFLLFLLLLGLLAGGCTPKDKVTTVEKYPTKPITMIVPFAAGGSADMMARAMEKVAQKHLGQSLVVTNIAGGASTIGMNELAGAKPDGYTIGYVSVGAILQPLYGQTRYHYATALEPLIQVMSTPIIAVVRSDQKWQDLDTLVRYAREHPGEIKYGHSGLGSGNHIVGELFAKAANIDITQVPFRGESEALAALLGGHVQLMFTNPPTVQEYVRSGKVKLLAVTSQERLKDPVFASVPTFNEQGIEVLYYNWHALGAPKGLSPEIKAQLTENLGKVIMDPEFQKNMESLGMSIEYLGPQQFSEKWASQNTYLTKVVKETGIADKIAAQKK
ncbi:tripartite tricarboxylate transporter substrate binding protein [bacterium BFN5]|nr:tripartite tricarboxylate transporter substrate binding protein [bacterium BFN5]QJW45156.1 tripartite tricarboxylate transporter substrate binding protein [bacterium BFN5]